ncbi:hypothetical protein M514_09524 [Trichuris suis]|uniref:Uncharacterized protein n=1 Tax=Trichuris suis TaxID=68888 RepID=A0A085NKZ8_9BILA|nr:hypothetical protein M514_09524 [Trichuris suis]
MLSPLETIRSETEGVYASNLCFRSTCSDVSMPVRLDTGESMNCDSNNAIFVDELQESRLDEGKCFEDFEQALEALAVQAEFEQYYEDVINMVTQTLSGDPESGQTEATKYFI